MRPHHFIAYTKIPFPSAPTVTVLIDMLLPTTHKITPTQTLSRTTHTFHLFIFHLVKTYQILLLITYYHTKHYTFIKSL